MGWNWLHLTARELFLVIAPTHLRRAVRDRNHGDAIIHRTHQRAEITADAILFPDLGDRFARHPSGAKAIAVWIHQVDALMRPILAGDVTEIATDAFIIVDPRNPFVVQIERFPFLQSRHRFAHEFHDTRETL